MPTRVMIDLLSFNGERGGTETYARQISRRLKDTEDVELVALVNRRGEARIREFFPGEIRVVPWVGAGRLTWALGEMFAVGRAARRARADVVWSPANFGPIRRTVPLVMTFHDVVYRTWRGGILDSLIRSTAWWMMLRTSKVANAVITGSQAAADELVEYAGVERGLIDIVPHGTAAPHPVDDPWSELAGLDIRPGRPVVLSTGNRLPHKNFVGLLEAVATIPASERPLTVIPGAHGDDILAGDVARLGLEKDVVLPGWVTLPQLEALFEVAALYACPSLTEGFGLPVIDAMRRACPVLANDIPVLREVGGSAARYADASDPAAFGHAIVTALEAGRDEQAITAGVEWASQFTWEASAKRTGEILTRTASLAGPRRG